MSGKAEPMAVNPVLRFLRRIRASDAARKTPDAELLARFIASHDEAAFAALVQRHGPMVLRLCVRILGDSPDAEDAFQATFLVLARRASSLSRPALLGNWLYGVAYRTALKVRADAVRRRTSGREELVVDAPNPVDEAARHELRRVMDDELSRLPDRYRVPLVLHYLEGRSQEEVAQLIGCPRKTITTRLARASERLRRRLTRRGVALSSGALAAALCGEAPASVPAMLRDATVKGAMLFVAGGSALVPATVVAFAEGVIQAMFLTKIKIALGCVLLLGAVVTGAGVLARSELKPVDVAQAQIDVPKDNSRRVAVAQPNKNPSKEDEGSALAGLSAAAIKRLLGDLRPGARISQLRKEQYEAARAEAEGRWKEFISGKAYQNGGDPVQNCLAGFRDLLQAELDLGRIGTDYQSALEGQIKRTQEFQAIYKKKYEAGQINEPPLELARFNRIRAEIWLEQYKTTGKLPADAPALPR